MITTYECEGCHTVVHYEGKELPYCPVCRGRMYEKDAKMPKEAKKIQCPECDREFYMTREPFKCPFCDHSFSLGTYW